MLCTGWRSKKWKDDKKWNRLPGCGCSYDWVPPYFSWNLSLSLAYSSRYSAYCWEYSSPFGFVAVSTTQWGVHNIDRKIEVLSHLAASQRAVLFCESQMFGFTFLYFISSLTIWEFPHWQATNRGVKPTSVWWLSFKAVCCRSRFSWASWFSRQTWCNTVEPLKRIWLTSIFGWVRSKSKSSMSPYSQTFVRAEPVEDFFTSARLILWTSSTLSTRLLTLAILSTFSTEGKSDEGTLTWRFPYQHRQTTGKSH